MNKLIALSISLLAIIASIFFFTAETEEVVIKSNVDFEVIIYNYGASSYTVIINGTKNGKQYYDSKLESGDIEKAADYIKSNFLKIRKFEGEFSTIVHFVKNDRDFYKFSIEGTVVEPTL
jgi:hypothetical protein